MKITVELPDSTVCASINYVFATSTGLTMGARLIDSEDIKNRYSKNGGEAND